MEEESDQSSSSEPGGKTYFSHFELYCQAMEEIGADTAPILEFIRRVDGGMDVALGREHIVPFMFRAFLDRMGVPETQAPRFHLYLNRHISLDQDFHGPLSLRLLNALCGEDHQKRTEAVRARIAFWDGVLLALKS